MKKILLGLSVIVLAGCTASGEEVTCNVNGQTETYVIKNGMIEDLTIDGKKQSSADVDELNGIYFTSAKNNDELKQMLDNYIAKKGGSCN